MRPICHCNRPRQRQSHPPRRCHLHRAERTAKSNRRSRSSPWILRHRAGNAMNCWSSSRSISSFDGAAEWAKRIIPIKNTLTAEHAREVEAALEVKLAQIGDGFGGTAQTSEARTDGPKLDSSPPPTAEVNPAGSVAPLPCDQTPALNFEDYAVTPKTRRRRDKRHRQFVAAQACVICGRQPSDAHHLRFAQPRGLGLKVSDEFTVPLCRSHHRELHRTRNEMRWWAQFGIQPKSIAYKLWTQSHPAPSPASPAGTNIEAPSPQLQRRSINPPALRGPRQRVRITKRTQFSCRAPMTSLKQIEANRRNALKSTGPTSEDGNSAPREMPFAMD